jgi:hypothetical protein
MMWALTLRIFFFRSRSKPVITPMTTMRAMTPTMIPATEIKVESDRKPFWRLTPRSSRKATKDSKKRKEVTFPA